MNLQVILQVVFAVVQFFLCKLLEFKLLFM